GAFVILLALGAIGLLVAFNLRPSDLTRPIVELARWVGAMTAASVRTIETKAPDAPATDRSPERAPARGRQKVAGAAAESTPGQTGIWSREPDDDGIPIPQAVPSMAPTSAT